MRGILKIKMSPTQRGVDVLHSNDSHEVANSTDKMTFNENIHILYFDTFISLLSVRHCGSIFLVTVSILLCDMLFLTDFHRMGEYHFGFNFFSAHCFFANIYFIFWILFLFSF